MESDLEDIVRCSCMNRRIADAQDRGGDAEALYAEYPVARRLDRIIRKGLRVECGRFRIEGLRPEEPAVGEYCFWAKDLVAHLLSPRELAGVGFTLHKPHALPATYWQDDLCRTLRKGILKALPESFRRGEF